MLVSVFTSYSLAHIPYLLVLWLVRRTPETRLVLGLLIAGALVFRIAAFAQPALLSDDVNRYRWEASVIAAGGNPYILTPKMQHVTDHSISGYDLSAVYGPVLEGIHYLVYRAGLPLKASAAIADGLFQLLLLYWTKSRKLPLWRWAMVGWSPICIFEFWMNGHNDAWLVLLLFGAAVLGGKLSWTALALATLTKWWPVLLLPLWLKRRFSLQGAAIYGLTMLPLFWLLPLDLWVEKIRFTTGFLGGWENNAFLYRLLSDKMQAIAIICAVAAILPWLRLGQNEAILLFVTAMLAFSANIHPWYLTWLLPFLALTRVNPLPWILPMALLPLAYDPTIGWRMNGVWRQDPAIRAYIWSAVLLYTLGTAIMKVEWRNTSVRWRS